MKTENKAEWQGWGHFLGTGNIDSRTKKKINDAKVKKILDELELNWNVYQRWTDSLIRNWFDEEGLFQLNDPYIRSFFSNFTDLRKTVEGKKALRYWLKSRKFKRSHAGFSLGGQAILAQQITRLQYTNKKKAKRLQLESDDIDAEKLLAELRSAKISIKDKNDPKVVFTVQLLWRAIFDPITEKREIKKIKKEKLNGNKFHDTIIIVFMKEYEAVKKIAIPLEWFSKTKPNLMQRYVSWKLTRTNGFFNLSNQGSGKSFSGVLATLTTQSKYTLIICPNNIVNQWRDVLQSSVNGAVVSIGAFPHEYVRGAKNYHVINYDKFSHAFTKRVVNNLNRQKYDFVILDETHKIKIRNERTVSNRRIMIMRLLKRMNAKNPNLKKLCLTATPLINNIREGKSMLQVITNEKFKDLGNLNTVREASKLHAHFLKYSIRYLRKYNIKVMGRNDFIKCKSEIPEDMSNEELESLSYLGLEQIAVKGKMKEIVKRINGKTIIYTEWVTGITDQIQLAVEKKGYKTAIFTGQQTPEEKSDAVDGFVNGDTDVLIASSTIAEGFDSLQFVCSNMIFATLPFTFAIYEHVIHRIIRERQASKTVRIHILSTELGYYEKGKWNGWEYDQRIKLNRLEFKKGMSVCVTEGSLPDKISLPRSKIKRDILKQIVKFRHSMVYPKQIAKTLQQKGKIKWKI